MGAQGKALSLKSYPGKGHSADAAPKGDTSAQKLKNVETFSESQKKAQSMVYIPRNPQYYDF